MGVTAVMGFVMPKLQEQLKDPEMQAELQRMNAAKPDLSASGIAGGLAKLTTPDQGSSSSAAGKKKRK